MKVYPKIYFDNNPNIKKSNSRYAGAKNNLIRFIDFLGAFTVFRLTLLTVRVDRPDEALAANLIFILFALGKIIVVSRMVAEITGHQYWYLRAHNELMFPCLFILTSTPVIIRNLDLLIVCENFSCKNKK